jgi:hypothetical protein
MNSAMCLPRNARLWMPAALLCSFAANAAVTINPPAYTEMSFQFDEGTGVPAGWVPISGSWSLGGGTYNSTAAVATALSIVDVVSALGIADGTRCHAPCFRSNPPVTWRDYVYRVRMLNQSAAANAWVGFVYEYNDANAYYEVLFSPTGVARLRRVQDGIVTALRTTTYREGGQNVWFDVELIRRGGRATTVRVNGNDVFRFGQNDIVGGLLGLVTHNTTGRFENVDEKGLYGNQPFLQTFTDPFATGQVPDAGTWTVEDGVYRYVSGADATAPSLSIDAPLSTSHWQLRDFGLRARLFNPYGASGNRVGLMWNYKRFDYNEVVFTPTGQALVNRVTMGGSVTLASASIPLLRGKWFEAELEARQMPDGQPAVDIRLDGKPLFTGLQGENVLPGGLHEGYVGLIAHWTPARVDRVNFQVGGFAPTYVQQFAAPPGDIVVASGSWETRDGAFESTALGQKDIAVLPTGSVSTASGINGSETYTYTPASFVYRARLRNPETGAASSVGLITNYTAGGEYYETVFTGTGEVRMNKIVQGTTVRQGTARHDVPPNTWFDVELRRVGTATSLSVNGVQLLTGIPQGQILPGPVGLITHAAQGSYDRISWFELR